MHFTSTCAFALSLFPQAFAQPVARAQNISSIQWTNCTTPLPGACGTLVVPLDYTNSSSNRTVKLNMVRIDATKKPSRGSILVNQGGPGLDGVSFIKGYGALLQMLFGGHYDIIGFDPRGTGKVTLPINCVPNPTERIRQALLAPLLVDEDNIGEALTWSKISGDNCYQQMGENVDFIGTAFVARDMIQIVDALGEDGLLRYWGQSYGTMLGMTAAAMFPDRIDKMVIDGVVNPLDYTFGWEFENIPVGEVALTKFLEACIETKNQSACALYRPDATVASLKKKIVDLVEEVKVKPILMGSNITTDILGPFEVKSAIEGPLRTMLDSASAAALYLNAIFEKNTTLFRRLRPYLSPDPLATISFGDAVMSIRCSDSTWRTDKIEDVKPLLQKATNLSSLYGDVYPPAYIGCAQWKAKARGRYEGDFKTKTKNPMLIIGSPYDLRTPLVSAQKAHELFEGSALLQHNGYGHCVLYSPGQCAIKAVQDYFTNGTLPKPGTVCEQDFGIFSGRTSWESFGLPPPAASAAK